MTVLARTRLRLLVDLTALLILLSGCPAAARGPDVGRLPVITSDDPVAQTEVRAADDLFAQKDLSAAEARYRRFLEERPNDRMVPLVTFSLGRVLLAQDRNADAMAMFRRVSEHPDLAIAEQGRFYLGVTSERMGQPGEAVTLLAPLVGRTIDPTDTALLLGTLASAYEKDARVADAIVTLQKLSEENVPEDDRTAARERLTQLAARKASPADVRRLFDEPDHESYAWKQIALRATRDADAARDIERTRELLEALEDEDVPFDDELAAIAMRAERPSDANPAAIGAILSLSGRARRVGEVSLRGLLLAQGLPDGPPAPGAPQLLFRDDAGRPDRAIEAVNELVSVHRVIAIIGPMDAQVALAAGQRAQELGVPLVALTPAGNLTEIGPMVFRYFPTPSAEVQALVAAARARGSQRFAVLHPDNAYGQTFVAALQAGVARAGGELVKTLGYAPGSTSFGERAAALAKSNFDALLVPDGAQTLASIAPALAAAGLWSRGASSAAPSGEGRRSITLLAPSIAFDAELAKLAGRYLQGALFSVPFDAVSEPGNFAERFTAQFSVAPDAFAAFAYDAYKLVRSAVDAGATTRQALADRLGSARTEGLVGPSPGFSKSREPARATQILELDGTTFRPLP